MNFYKGTEVIFSVMRLTESLVMYECFKVRTHAKN